MSKQIPVRVHVVIVNYRTAELVVDCLRSLELERSDIESLRVSVVDNCSGDGSAARFREAVDAEGWQDWVHVLPLGENRGFAAGNNAVIAPALAGPTPADYFLLLNPDTYVRRGAVRALVEFMECHPNTGISGSRLEDPDGTLQVSCFRFPSILGELENSIRLRIASFLLAPWKVAPDPIELQQRVDWVAGASMLIRRELLEGVGLFDSKFFLYFEEVDFCLAAHRAGWECHYVPASRVVHLVGQSSGITTPNSTLRRPGYWFDSRRRYFCKNHGGFYGICADLVWILGFGSWRARRRFKGGPDTDPPHLLSDFIHHSTLVKPHDPHSPETASGSIPHPDGLRAQLKEDWISHDCDSTRPGFRAVAVHRIGVWRLGISNKLLRAPFSVLYRMLFRRVRNRYGIELPYSVKLGRRVVIEHQGAIVVHGSSVIGDDCIIRHGVTLGIRSLERDTEAPVLGNRVNVGAGAKILGSVKVGDHAQIGANAVVLSDVPDGAKAVGIPARVIPSLESWQHSEPES